MDTTQGAFVGDAECGPRAESSLVPALTKLRARARRLLRSQRERVRRFEMQLNSQLPALLASLEEARAKSTSGQGDDKREEELSRLRAERDELAAMLEQSEHAAQTAAANRDNQQEAEDLRRRYEMAVEELRELQAENAQLKDELSAAPTHAAGTDALDSRTFDWETHKKRMLAQLESDADSPDPQQHEDRLTVEGAIRITDQVVAEKDREIAELKALLENQASNLGSVAVGVAAVAEVFDRDELVREERESLQRLQEEWREKLRQSEVEISIERAKTARERLALEEKLRALEAERSQAGADGGTQAASDKAKGRTRGRWLAHLGLHDDNG